MGHYKLKCLHPDCGRVYEHDNYRLHCDDVDKHGPALLRTIYKENLQVKHNLPGIFKFIDWLPCGDNFLDIECKPITYKSRHLASYLGLSNLWIAFSGYWPERGSTMVTRTFKDLEAITTIARYLSTDNGKKPLFVSSVGNAATAFNYHTTRLGLPLYLIVPISCIDFLKLPIKNNPVVIGVNGDYSDAIKLSSEIAQKTGLQKVGGAENIARRDGMAVVMLEAVTTAKTLFDHYFQAVGSGSGAISMHEAVQRLIKDGRYGNKLTTMHLSQNLPFAPLVKIWEKDLTDIHIPDSEKVHIQYVTTEILTNRDPPYMIPGGIRDMMKDTNGHMYAVSNRELFDAGRIFFATEGIDCGPAAAVAVASLMQAITKGTVGRNDKILLHVTDGGLVSEINEYGNNKHGLKLKTTISPGQADKAVRILGKINPIENHKELLQQVH